MEFIDLKAQYRALQPAIDAGVRKVLESTRFIGGPEVKELENRLHAPVSVAEYPDLIGAIGAALFAREADH